MTEAQCKAALCKVLRGEIPLGEGRVYRHEDQFTGGIPDISITLQGRTLWVEVKLDRPGRRGKVTELQRAALRDLRGVLLVFAELKDGGFGATLLSAEGFVLFVANTEKQKAPVYRDVANRLIYILLKEGA